MVSFWQGHKGELSKKQVVPEGTIVFYLDLGPMNCFVWRSNLFVYYVKMMVRKVIDLEFLRKERLPITIYQFPLYKQVKF